MDIKRTVLWVIFFMSAVMLFDNWQRDHGRPSMFFPNTTRSSAPVIPMEAIGSSAMERSGENSSVIAAIRNFGFIRV